jgi:cytochrome P450
MNRSRWETICQDPESIPAVVEECLRHSGSVIAWRRRAITDVQVGGAMIPKGANMLMVIASANHDDTVFEDPYAFDLDRANNDAHVAFRHGSHICLGNHFARLEMRIFLEESSHRMPGVRLKMQEISYLPNTSFRGPEALLVEWDP